MKKYFLSFSKLIAFIIAFALGEFLTQPIVQYSADLISNDYVVDLIKIFLEVLVAVVVVKAFLWKKSFRDIGLSFRINIRGLYMLLLGLIIGSFTILVIWAFKGFVFDRFIWDKLFAEDIIAGILIGILDSIGIAVTEGLVIRGYIYNFLSKKNVYLGIILSSLIYVLINILTLGFNILPIMGYFLFSILLTFIFILTGNLFYSIVFHGAWYFTNIYIFSPESSQAYGVIMLNHTDKVVLNGGDVGVMGSIIFVVLILILDILAFIKVKRLADNK